MWEGTLCYMTIVVLSFCICLFVLWLAASLTYLSCVFFSFYILGDFVVFWDDKYPNTDTIITISPYSATKYFLGPTRTLLSLEV